MTQAPRRPRQPVLWGEPIATGHGGYADRGRSQITRERVIAEIHELARLIGPNTGPFKLADSYQPPGRK